jgi:hypothetical protein
LNQLIQLNAIYVSTIEANIRDHLQKHTGGKMVKIELCTWPREYMPGPYEHVFFAAVTCKGHTSAFVVHLIPVDGRNQTRVKTYPEIHGPAFAGASKEFLDMLSEPKNENAAAWRALCRENLTSDKKRLLDVFG